MSSARPHSRQPGSAGPARAAAALLMLSAALCPPGVVRAAEETVPPVSSAVAKIIVLKGNETTAQERLEILHRLTPRIPLTDAEALLSFAAKPCPEGFYLPYWRVLVNDTFDLLLQMKVPPRALDRELARMAKACNDPVLRDYALQKLGGRLKQQPLPDAARQEALEALKAAAARHGQDFQGTALLAWQRAAAPAEDPELNKAILACLESPQATPRARTTALQAGSACGLRAIAPAARRVLEDPQSTVSARLSALAALGTSGEATDIPLIRGFEADPVCGPPARTALKKLTP